MTEADRLVSLKNDALEDECMWVDWQEEEEYIVKYFNYALPYEKITPFWKGDDLWFRCNKKEYIIPLTFSPVDRYVAVSSVANVVKDKYQVRILKSSLFTDTHGLLILTHEIWEDLDKRHSIWTSDHFQQLEIGHDYFSGSEITYTGREKENN